MPHITTVTPKAASCSNVDLHAHPGDSRFERRSAHPAAHASYHGLRRAWGSARVAPLAITLGLFAAGASAGLIPTEVYYNGPLPGSDPDEFVELTNVGQDTIRVAGFRFDEGLGLDFPDLALAGGESLVVAPNPAGFAQAFPDFRGAILDARGGLSNAGETLSLLDGNGSLVFRFAYDDSGAWPASADGIGDSLQLIPGFADLGDPLSWESGSPTPGAWRGAIVVDTGDAEPSPVSTPGTLPLLLGSSAMLWAVRRRRDTSLTRHVASTGRQARWSLRTPAG